RRPAAGRRARRPAAGPPGSAREPRPRATPHPPPRCRPRTRGGRARRGVRPRGHRAGIRGSPGQCPRPRLSQGRDQSPDELGALDCRRGTFCSADGPPRRAKVDATGPTGSTRREIVMRRKTFDALLSTGGIVVAAVLIIAGALLTWGHSFVDNQVHTQLAAQK